MLQLARRNAYLGKDQKRLRKRYVQLRESSLRLNTRILDHLPSCAFVQCARALGLRHGGPIVLTNTLEADVILDYALHDYRRGRVPGGRTRTAVPPRWRGLSR